MTIILSGGGNPEDVIPLDKYFSHTIDLHKTVLYIPIAMEAHVFSYNECFTWFKNTYGDYGITNVEMCTDLNTLNLNNQYSAVFIGGGNTFKLLNEIHHSNFASQIHLYLKSGGVLYGGSAGAIVCGRTIEPALFADENYIGMKNLAGINLLDGYDVFCHYDSDKHDSFINSLESNLYILYEESGLIFNGSLAMPIGKTFLQKSF